MFPIGDTLCAVNWATVTKGFPIHNLRHYSVRWPVCMLARFLFRRTIYEKVVFIVFLCHPVNLWWMLSRRSRGSHLIQLMASSGFWKKPQIHRYLRASRSGDWSTLRLPLLGLSGGMWEPDAWCCRCTVWRVAPSKVTPCSYEDTRFSAFWR